MPPTPPSCRENRGTAAARRAPVRPGTMQWRLRVRSCHPGSSGRAGSCSSWCPRGCRPGLLRRRHEPARGLQPQRRCAHGWPRLWGSASACARHNATELSGPNGPFSGSVMDRTVHSPDRSRVRIPWAHDFLARRHWSPVDEQHRQGDRHRLRRRRSTRGGERPQQGTRR